MKALSHPLHNTKAALERHTLVLAPPKQDDSYYQEDYADILEFYAEYGAKILGVDNLVVLCDKQAYRYLQRSLPHEVLLLCPQDDIWIRDFCGISTYSSSPALKFRYKPREVNQDDIDDIESTFKQMSLSHEVLFKEVPYFLDGGNFVSNNIDTAILTKAFLRDNCLEEAEAKQILSGLTGYKYIVFIDYDETDLVPHSDGLVMFGNANRLFMHHDGSDRSAAIEQQLLSQIPSNVEIIKIPQYPKKVNPNGYTSATGSYANSVVTPSSIYMPAFGNPALDQEVAGLFEKHTGKNVIQIPARSSISDLGGSCRCLTWEMSNQQASNLIEAARKINFVGDYVTRSTEDLSQLTMDKLGYPEQHYTSHDLLDNSNIGLQPDSLANRFLLQFGDPQDNASVSDANEARLVQTIGRFIGFTDPYGYVTSGGSEANMAALWWILQTLTRKSQSHLVELQAQIDRETTDCSNLKNLMLELHDIQHPVLFCSADGHYSIFKAATILGFQVIKINVDHNGEMCLESFKEQLRLRGGLNKCFSFAVVCNYGTTFRTGFDNIPKIKVIIEEAKTPYWNYAIHVDAAFYGPAWNALNLFAFNVNEVSTFALSLYKILGSPIVSGLVLANKSFLKQGVIDMSELVQYANIRSGVTLHGSRPSLPVLVGLNICDQLISTGRINDIVQENIEKANYFVAQAKRLAFIQEAALFQRYFNIRFPSKYVTQKMIDKYTLMVMDGQVQLTIGKGVTFQLIDQFIEAMQEHHAFNSQKQVSLAKKTGVSFAICQPTFFSQNVIIKDNSYQKEEYQVPQEQVNGLIIKEHQNIQKILEDNQISHKVVFQPHFDAHDAVYLSDSYFCLQNEDIPGGVIFQMPMFWHNRQLEKNEYFVNYVMETIGYKHYYDLSYFETHQKALEGRGVLILDQKQRKFYVGLTNRAHIDCVSRFVQILNELSINKTYSYLAIDSYDEVTKMVPFHTSCYMQIFSEVCFIHWESIRNEDQKREIYSSLEGHYEVIGLTYEEMDAGVSLGVEFINEDGASGIILSETAVRLMSPQIRTVMEKHFNPIIAAPIPVNEEVGGSSIECMFQTIPIFPKTWTLLE